MSTSKFNAFRDAVAAQFKRMAASGELFTTCVNDKNELFDTYLGAFPPGTDPIYRTHTEHNCSCCKQFIRQVGHVVAIVNGRRQSIWDISGTGIDATYLTVAKALAAHVHRLPVESLLRTREHQSGKLFNFDLQGVKHTHFFLNHPDRVISDEPRAEVGRFNADRHVFARSLEEIDPEATETVLELIAQNSLYRGAESRGVLQAFLKHQRDFLALPDAESKTLYTLRHASNSSSSAILRMRNTAMGTLLQDISAGVTLDDAVATFERIMAPANYQRPKALVTPQMVADAKAKVEALGLGSALHRRHANLNDLSVNDVLFADRNTTPAALSTDADDAFSGLSTQGPVHAKQFSKLESVSLQHFLTAVLPGAKTIEVLFENRQAGNLVSLITAQDATAQPLFKWNNAFSWSYAGDFADVVKARVKNAGGLTEGDLCCRLAWDTKTDLDFHMKEPDGNLLYYPRRRSLTACGGILDVDANGADGQRTDPVENIVYADAARMKPGVYELLVHTYARRVAAGDDTNYQVHIEMNGERHEFHAGDYPADKQRIALIKKKPDGTLTLISFSGSSSVAASRTLWGLQTQTWQRVSVVMKSPNAWSHPAIGNEHVFFMLDQCVNDGSARGFYNEFLKPELAEHRKVLELVGAKMRTETTEHQLSGLGFSTTKPAELLVRVTGRVARTLKVVI